MSENVIVIDTADISAPTSPNSHALKAKLQSRSPRPSPSKADVDARLENAENRRSEEISSRQMRAGKHFEHAKEVSAVQRNIFADTTNSKKARSSLKQQEVDNRREQMMSMKKEAAGRHFENARTVAARTREAEARDLEERRSSFDTKQAQAAAKRMAFASDKSAKLNQKHETIKQSAEAAEKKAAQAREEVRATNEAKVAAAADRAAQLTESRRERAASISQKGEVLRQQAAQRRADAATMAMQRMEQVVSRGNDMVEQRRKLAAARSGMVEQKQRTLSEKHSSFVASYQKKTDDVYKRQAKEVAKRKKSAADHIEHVKQVLEKLRAEIVTPEMLGESLDAKAAAIEERRLAAIAKKSEQASAHNFKVSAISFRHKNGTGSPHKGPITNNAEFPEGLAEAKKSLAFEEAKAAAPADKSGLGFKEVAIFGAGLATAFAMRMLF